MLEQFQEFCDWRGGGLRVDRQSGVIRGVKLLGPESRNGRIYLPEAMAAAAALYEDAKVNVNHAKGHAASARDYQDRIGVVRGVVVREGEGLFADLHFNPKHVLAEQLLWDAEHAPENVGLSHNVEARTARQGDRVVVEAITRVMSVDLVADPATTRGLFESAPVGTCAPPQSVEDLKRDYPELVEELIHEQAVELGRLRAEVERLEAAEAARRKHQAVRRLLSEFHLPAPDGGDAQAAALVGPRFLEQLMAAADERAMRELVEERAALVEALGRGTAGSGAAAKPLCRDQHAVLGGADLDVKKFVEAIT